MSGGETRVLVLRVVGALLAILGGGAVLFGFGLVAADLADRTDEWDGLMIFLGVLVAVPGLLLVLAGVTVIRSARRGNATSAVVTGVVGVATMVAAVQWGDALGLALTTPLLVAGLVLVAVAAVCGRPGTS